MTSETLTASTSKFGARLRRHPSVVLTAILVVQLMLVLDGTVVNIALPQIRDSLQFSTANLSWVINAYTLSFGGLLLLGARAGDLIGRRTTFLWGVALFTVASMAGGIAQNPGELLAARAIQGVGAAFASPATLALLMSMFPEPRERTRAIGLFTAVAVGGGAVGLVAGGMLTEWASWRWVLYINVPIGLVVIVLGYFTVPASTRVRGAFDFTGALTSTIGMAALVYGFVVAATDGWGATDAVISFVVGVVLMAAFIVTERRAESPITPLRLFADRNRAAAYVSRLFLVAGMFSMFFFLSQFAQLVLGYSPLRTGFAFVPLTVVVFASSQLSSRFVVERFGGKAAMIVGVTLSTVGLAWLSQISASSGYGAIFGPLVVFGFGNGMAFVPMTTTALANVDPSEQGAASGLVNVMQQVGGSLGLAILVTVFGATTHHLTGNALSSHEYVVGVDRVFALGAAFVFVVLLLTIFVIRMPHRPTTSLSPAEELLEDLEATAAVSATSSG